MLWEEVLVDRELTDDEVMTTMVALFAVSPDAVLVVDDITAANVSEKLSVVCERTPIRGDFSLRLSIYLHDPALEQLDRIAIVGQFCDLLHCKCLISDDSVNPYAMLLVEGSARQQPVFLDPERLDAEEYVLDKKLSGAGLKT